MEPSTSTQQSTGTFVVCLNHREIVRLAWKLSRLQSQEHDTGNSRRSCRDIYSGCSTLSAINRRGPYPALCAALSYTYISCAGNDRIRPVCCDRKRWAREKGSRKEHLACIGLQLLSSPEEIDLCLIARRSLLTTGEAAARTPLMWVYNCRRIADQVETISRWLYSASLVSSRRQSHFKAIKS
ncbi:hypothetical protein J6590_011522 [Homalodisca vitripennis]|nr:hypothetical protein J6590_011522 [Homalodisca vitripennis]